MPRVSLDNLEYELDNFENFMYSNFDTQYITYSYETNLAGDFVIELPSMETLESLLEMGYEDVMEFLENEYDMEVLLYGDE